METLAVPYHLDQFIPGFDVGVPVDTEIRADLPDSGTWQRMGILYEQVAQVVSSHHLPVLVVSGDCTTSLGVIAGLQRAGRDPGLVWIDAHGDFNTEATSPSGYLGGLPLALAVGIGTLTLPHQLRLRPIPVSRAVLVGARDLDADEVGLLERSQIERRGVDLTAADLPQGDLHLHIDIDICDPKLVPDLLFPAVGGPALHDVLAAVRRIVATGRVVAVDLAATWHHNGPSASTQRHVMESIAEAVCAPGHDHDSGDPLHINPGDTAWMLVATALVFFMMPGLALFYGGLVGEKNRCAPRGARVFRGPARGSTQHVPPRAPAK